MIMHNNRKSDSLGECVEVWKMYTKGELHLRPLKSEYKGSYMVMHNLYFISTFIHEFSKLILNSEIMRGN